ncbi:MAG: hypothetical protein KatS3mg076_2277 [Candidatus Binatia bacterium]|nr:MAG: hypothetical protein KatS3mg076_2277 [Candidatus Binatia bacterium]
MTAARVFSASGVLFLFLLSCGGRCVVELTGGTTVGCDLVPPGPDDPAFGTAALVLVADSSGRDRLWVGFEDEAEVAEFETLACGELGFFVGGRVVVASNRELGFFFDPRTTEVRESPDTDHVTSLGEISANPRAFAEASLSQGVSWFVPAAVVASEPPVFCDSGA